jgi:hypothetical protein
MLFTGGPEPICEIDISWSCIRPSACTIVDGMPLTVLQNHRIGERGRNRTFNLLIKSQLLCQLSYAPVTLGKMKQEISGRTLLV